MTALARPIGSALVVPWPLGSTPGARRSGRDRRGRRRRGVRRDRWVRLCGRCSAGSLVLPFDQVPGRPRTADGESDHAGGDQPDPEALELTASSGRWSRRTRRVGQPLNEDVIRLQSGNFEPDRLRPPSCRHRLSSASGTESRLLLLALAVVPRPVGGVLVRVVTSVLVRAVPVLGALRLVAFLRTLRLVVLRVLERLRVGVVAGVLVGTAVVAVVGVLRGRRLRRVGLRRLGLGVVVVSSSVARSAAFSRRWARASAARAWPSAACSLTSWPFLFTTAVGSGSSASANAVAPPMEERGECGAGGGELQCGCATHGSCSSVRGGLSFPTCRDRRRALHVYSNELTMNCAAWVT